MMLLLFFPWSICTSTILATFLFFPFVYTEIFDFAKCDITEDFQSRYVSSSFRSLKPGQSCESNSTSTSGLEVHVIMVNAPADKSGWATVRLSVHSRRQSNLKVTEGVDYQEQHRPLMMVLYSVSHVKWRVDIDGISSQDKHMFTIAKGSSIKFFRKRTRLSAKSRKRDFKFGMNKSDLYHWAKSRFGGVTSFNVISDVSVQFYAGRDVNANLMCNVNALNESLRIFSFIDVSLPISGCVSKRRSHVIAKPVYIVELLEPPPYSPGITGVDLELLLHKEEDEEDNPNDIRNCYLVIKSAKNFTWNVHSKFINGQIEIVYDADVRTTGIKYSTVGSRSDVISATGGKLVQWTQEHVAPVLLYAGIRGANTIKLNIPSLERTMASPRERTTRPNQNKTPSSWIQHKDTKPDLQDNNAQADLIHTTCLGHEMKVSISKTFIQVTGLENFKISLKDPTCVPEEETVDFIILRTSLYECGTQSSNVDDMTSFTNVVLIQTTPGFVNSLLQDELGSGFFDGEQGSGSRDLAAVTDDEDYGVQPVNITVECKLPTQIISEVRPEPSATTCHMTLYRDLLFLRSRTEYPISVAKDSTIYLKGSSDDDSVIQVDSCWFSTSKQPFQIGAETQLIIRNGCEQNITVAILDSLEAMPSTQSTTPQTEAKFKIIMKEMFKRQSSVYLHCQFYTCQKHNVDCPVNRHERCRHPGLTTQVSQPNCGPVTIGPLEITEKEINIKPTIVHPTPKGNTNEDSSNLNQQHRIIIEGLDSATVVGIAFAAFAIGILLTGALWFIHSHTGPVKRVVTNHREPDASGDLTPNSSSPMTA